MSPQPQTVKPAPRTPDRKTAPRHLCGPWLPYPDPPKSLESPFAAPASAPCSPGLCCQSLTHKFESMRRVPRLSLARHHLDKTGLAQHAITLFPRNAAKAAHDGFEDGRAQAQALERPGLHLLGLFLWASFFHFLTGILRCRRHGNGVLLAQDGP